VSRDRGNRAPAWVAEYLTRWWPGAEKNPNGRAGADLLGTPGVSFEIKTGTTWRTSWGRQAEQYPGLQVLVYLPPGMGEQSVQHAHCIMPLHVLMQVLVEGGYAPQPREVTP
jgi:hypothetical protein